MLVFALQTDEQGKKY